MDLYMYKDEQREPALLNSKIYLWRFQTEEKSREKETTFFSHVMPRRELRGKLTI